MEELKIEKQRITEQAVKKIHAFKKHLIASKTVEESTANRYVEHLMRFFEFAKKNPEEIVYDDVENYINKLDAEIKDRSSFWEKPRTAISKAYQGTFISILSRFYSWRKNENIELINEIYEELQPKPNSPKKPCDLKVEEVERLVNAKYSVREDLAERDALIVRFLYSVGLRSQELCGLTLSVLEKNEPTDDGKGIMFVLKRETTKGKKERNVTISKKLFDDYKAFRNKYGYDTKIRKEDRDYLFFTRYDNPVNPLAVFRIVKGKATRAGLKNHQELFLHTHDMRSSFASEKAKYDKIEVVAQTLGNKVATAEKYYVNVNAERVKGSHTVGV